MDDSLRYGGCRKDGSVTVMLGGMDDAGTQRHRPAPTSVTLGLTLTAIPPDDDEEMLFPLDRASIMAKAVLHRYAGWGR